MIIRIFFLALLLGICAVAQNAQRFYSFLEAGKTVKIAIPIDMARAEDEMIELDLGQQGVVVKLELPDGTLLDESQFVENGFRFERLSFLQRPESSKLPDNDSPRPFQRPRFFSIVVLSAKAPLGTYTFHLSTAIWMPDTSVSAAYRSWHGREIGVTSVAPTYFSDEHPILRASAQVNHKPIPGLSIRGRYWRQVPISGISLNGFTLVKESQFPTYVERTYSYSISNTGTARRNVLIKLVDGFADFEFGSSWISHEDVPAGNSSTERYRITLAVPNFPQGGLSSTAGVPAAPDKFRWSVEASDDEASFKMVDGGSTSAGKAGDGIYAVSLPILLPGNYSGVVELSGTILGRPYAGTQFVTFKVEPRNARIVEGPLWEVAIREPGTPIGKIKSLQFGGRVAVTRPGEYRFRLRWGLGERFLGGGIADSKLAVGTHRMFVAAPAADFIRSGAGGPYTLSAVRLEQKFGDEYRLIEERTLTRPTKSYRLEEFDRGDFFLKGPVSAKGLNPDSSGRFGVLRVTVPVVTPGGACRWEASLSGTVSTAHVARERQEGELPLGLAKVEFDFDSNEIALSEVAGPYTFGTMAMKCGARTALISESVKLVGFTKSLFRPFSERARAVSSAILISVPRGKSVTLDVDPWSDEQLWEALDLKVSDLPKFLSVELEGPKTIRPKERRKLTITVAQEAPMGEFEVVKSVRGGKFQILVDII